MQKVTEEITKQDYYKLNLSEFTHGYEEFENAVINFFVTIFNENKQNIILPKRISDFYLYKIKDTNTYSKKDYLSFIIDKFFKEKEILLGFLQECMEHKPSYLEGFESESYKLKFNDNLILLVENPVFSLDFYFDKTLKKFSRKIDIFNIIAINDVNISFKGSKKNLYERCVSDFINFKKIDLKDVSANDFYHQSLDNMKELVEDRLSENFSKVKLSQKKRVRGILFDNENINFENFLDFIIQNIHHNSTFQRIQINEKEYNYYWLELNNILYLLSKYKT